MNFDKEPQPHAQSSYHSGRPNAPYLPGCSPINLSNRKHTRQYLDAHKNVEKRRRDRINNCLETIWYVIFDSHFKKYDYSHFKK